MSRLSTRIVRFTARHRVAVGVGVALVLIRIALPYAVRPLLERQASKMLNARVTIGDVDLTLHRAGIALDDVAVRPAGWTPDTDAGDPPLIAWRRFAVAVRWLPLFWKTIQLRELVLESPRLAIDRLQEGGLNLMALVPATTDEEAAASPEAEPGSRWSFGIDRVVLRDGGVRFRDLMIARVEPVDLSLGSFEVADIALSPSIYGGPAHIHLQARVDEGRFVLDATLAPRDDGGFALGSHLKARKLPLRRTRVYVPRVGWSELQGEFGGALDYTLETGGRNEVRGQVTVDGLTVHTPQLDGPGLAWKRLAVLVDPIDLAGQRAVVRRVELDGSYLVARARGGVVFPFIEAVLTGEPQATPPGAPPQPPVPADEPAPPWEWQVDRVTVWNSLLHVISPDASFDAGCTLSVDGLRGQGTEPATISLALGIGDGGTVTVDGKTHIQPLGFAGRVSASQVPLPDIVATAGAFPPGVVQRAALDADLGIAAGLLAPVAGDLRAEGTIAFGDLYLVGAGGPTTQFGATRLAFGMQELLVPGALATEPPAVAPDARLTGGSVALQGLWAVRTDPTPFDVRAGTLDATLDELAAPGIGPPPADGGALRLRARMRVTDLVAGNAGGSGLDVGVRAVDVGVGELVLPGILATDPSAVKAPLRLARGSLALSQPGAAGAGAEKLDMRAQRTILTVGELLVPGALGGAPGPVQVRAASLEVDGPRFADNRGGPRDAGARGIDVSLASLDVPAAGEPLRLRGGRLALSEARVADARGDTIELRARGIELGIGDLAAPIGGGAGTELRGGTLTLAEPAVIGADPRAFAIGARAIGVLADRIALPPTGPTRAMLRNVTLTSPRVQLTRTAEGLELPAVGGGAVPAPAPAPGPAVTVTRTPADRGAARTPPPAAAGAVPAAPAPPSGTAAAVDLVISSFRLTDGRIGVTDRSVKPVYVGGLAPLSIDVADLRWPAMQVGRLRIDATSAEKGTIGITGTRGPSGGTLEVNGKDISLKQFNPYAVSLSPYSIKKGRLSLVTKATFTPSTYDSASTVVLHDFDLGSRAGDSLFKEQFGIPLSMALALLRDLHGDIKLDIPVEGDEQGMRIGYLTIVAGALRRALVGALTSPLKLVGAVFSGDKVQAAPAPIGFRTGQATLTHEGGKQVEQLGKFLAERPAMGVALQSAPIATDARALHEQDLLAELGAPQGVVGRLRTLTSRGARDRITQALAARAEGKAGELSPDDQQTLDEWLAERPAPTPKRVDELARSRLTRVEEALRQQHGIDAARIVRRDPPPEPSDTTPPTVEIELGSVEDLKAPPPEEAAVTTQAR